MSATLFIIKHPGRYLVFRYIISFDEIIIPEDELIRECIMIYNKQSDTYEWLAEGTRPGKYKGNIMLNIGCGPSRIKFLTKNIVFNWLMTSDKLNNFPRFLIRPDKNICYEWENIFQTIPLTDSDLIKIGTRLIDSSPEDVNRYRSVESYKILFSENGLYPPINP